VDFFETYITIKIKKLGDVKRTNVMNQPHEKKQKEGERKNKQRLENVNKKQRKRTLIWRADHPLPPTPKIAKTKKIIKS
tara:strand:+ start:56 stop:292 length:237 start_codon:yes stop_codon:yes gene_type:complete